MCLAPYLCLELLLCFVLILVAGLESRMVELIGQPSRDLEDLELRVVRWGKEHARSIALIELLEMLV